MCGEVVAAPLSLQDTVYPILRKKSLHFCEKSKKFLKLCTAARKKYKMKRLRRKYALMGTPSVSLRSPAPPGGAVAQRLRGYKWRSEKSVKAIAPTGAALAFLCFDFFFRIVKGVQPLARCGVGGVQR